MMEKTIDISEHYAYITAYEVKKWYSLKNLTKVEGEWDILWIYERRSSSQCIKKIGIHEESSPIWSRPELGSGRLLEIWTPNRYQRWEKKEKIRMGNHWKTHTLVKVLRDHNGKTSGNVMIRCQRWGEMPENELSSPPLRPRDQLSCHLQHVLPGKSMTWRRNLHKKGVLTGNDRERSWREWNYSLFRIYYYCHRKLSWRVSFHLDCALTQHTKLSSKLETLTTAFDMEI